MRNTEKINPEEKVFWASTKELLSKDQLRAFAWIIKIFKKRPEELTDLEKEAQKIYKNVIIF